jgi:hypothetical protein
VTAPGLPGAVVVFVDPISRNVLGPPELTVDDMALNLTHDGIDDTLVGADSHEPERPTFAELYNDADSRMLRLAALLIDTIHDADIVQLGDYTLNVAGEFCVTVDDLEATDGWSQSSSHRARPTPAEPAVAPRLACVP